MKKRGWWFKEEKEKKRFNPNAQMNVLDKRNKRQAFMKAES
jgi:hypothetical protein